MAQETHTVNPIHIPKRNSIHRIYQPHSTTAGMPSGDGLSRILNETGKRHNVNGCMVATATPKQARNLCHRAAICQRVNEGLAIIADHSTRVYSLYSAFFDRLRRRQGTSQEADRCSSWRKHVNRNEFAFLITSS